MTFPEAVWRLRFRVDGQRNISFNWQNVNGIEIDGQHVDNSRYQIVVNGSNTEIRRLTLPILNIGVSSGQGASNNAWHTFEASSYLGDIQVWIDGERRAGYVDPQPLPTGSIGLELLPPDSSAASTISFDNISVCGLNAPFVSLYTPQQ
jgi:hypothetical protein